jgi:hypothetical protein
MHICSSRCRFTVQGSASRLAEKPIRLMEGGKFDQAKYSAVSAGNSKSQIPNHKQIPMIKIQNSKPVWDIGYLNLRFVCYLVIGI